MSEIGTVRRRLSATAIAALFGVAFGCGGGGGGGGGVTPSTCVTYVAASQAATFTTAAGSAACSTVQVRVLLNDVQDVYGSGFDVTFDPTVVGYSGADVGNSHLGSDGNSLLVLGDDPAPTGTATVTVGITRSGQVPGIDFVGAQELCTLTFRKIASSGSSALTFSNLVLKDPNGSDFQNVTASGGTFTVR